MTDQEPWLHAYLELGADLREAGLIGGISHQEVSNRLKELDIPVRTLSETNALRTKLAIAKHGDAIKESFLQTRNVAVTAAEVGVAKKVVETYLAQEVPDYQVLARAPRNVGKNFTTEELAASLKEAATTVPGNLSVEAYRRFISASPTLSTGRNRPGPQAMHLRFGSWNGALEAAGLPANPPAGPPKQYDNPITVLESVVACWQSLGHPPTVADYDKWQRGKEGHPSPAIAVRVLGSWNTALVRAWQVVHDHQLDQDDLDVAIPTGLGQPSPEFLPYSPADEKTTLLSAVQETQSALPELEKAVRNHAKLQNSLANLVKAHGRDPLSPGATEAKFDLAFRDDNDALVVAEIKSCTNDNLEGQLRLGLGQVLRYAHQLRQTHTVVRPVLVTQLEPPEDWRLLLTELGVASIHEAKLGPGLATVLQGC
ncbi:homing endonuclease associated repeat-containing protein [Oryzihumus leptocrescens]|nr:hypothetical protein [Oryzihumus leptocrescens]